MGPLVEGTFGSSRFLLTYVLSGLAGNVASTILNPKASSVGASGAIFGLVGAYSAYCVQNRKLLGSEGRDMLGGLAVTIAINLGLGMMRDSNIDNWGHIGGLLGGAATGLLIGPRLRIGYSTNVLLPRAEVVDRSLWPAIVRAADRLIS